MPATDHGAAIPLVLMFLGVLVFLAHLFQIGFQRFRIPDALGLIVIGLILGPLMNWVRPEAFGETGQVFTTIALAVILFEAGLDLKVRELRTALAGAVLLTLTVYALTFATSALVIHYVAGMPWQAAIFGGAVVAAPSPPVIISLLRHLPFPEEIKTIATLESTLGEALGLVLSLAILKVVSVDNVAPGELVGMVIGSFIVAGVVGSLAGAAWSFLLAKIRPLNNSMILTPSMVFVVFGLCDFMGFSGPIGALAFGFTLGSFHLLGDKISAWLGGAQPAEYNKDEIRFLGELVFILKTFFFIYLGLSMHKEDFWSPAALAIVGVMFLSRLLSVRVCLARYSLTSKELTSLSGMVPKGLAAAVMAAAASQAPNFEMGDQVENLIYSVILYSILFTAVMVFFSEKCGLHRAFAILAPRRGKQGDPLA